MLFNSLHYALFLPFVVFLYYGLPTKFRWAFLLGASYYFYMCWRPEYAVLIVVSTVVDYVCAIRMENARSGRRRTAYLCASLTANLGLLFAFKYFNLFCETANWLFGSLRLPVSIGALDVLLPIGISFYTFQTLSYSIDVYRGRRPAERHFGIFALYVSFFPQLVAGPIERSEHLLPQLQQEHSFNHRNIEDGLKLILWGFFKKLVIADRLAVYVNTVYGDPGAFGGGPLTLATYFFAFQIYCDFSGYSDIAIGSAQLIGYDLRLNFRRPYLSNNIREFWSRWHVSLSSWFRDYLYIPLGGSRVRTGRWIVNILVVFVVSGIWHGAAWTFAIWGLIHGVLLLLHRLFTALCGKIGVPASPSGFRTIYKAAAILLTFHAVLLGWVFFRAESVADAGVVLSRIASLEWLPALSPADFRIAAFGLEQLAIAVVAIGFLLVMEILGSDDFRELLKWRWRPLRWAYYYAVLLATVNFGMFHNPQQFIYFQF